MQKSVQVDFFYRLIPKFMVSRRAYKIWNYCRARIILLDLYPIHTAGCTCANNDIDMQHVHWPLPLLNILNIHKIKFKYIYFKIRTIWIVKCTLRILC